MKRTPPKTAIESKYKLRGIGRKGNKVRDNSYWNRKSGEKSGRNLKTVQIDLN